MTDAGFRGPWFRALEAMGWQWLGRLRNTTYLRSVMAPNKTAPWISYKTLYRRAKQTPRDIGLIQVARSNPLTARIVLHTKPPSARKQRTRQGLPSRDWYSRSHAKRKHEPWLLMASPSLKLNARQLVALYTRRMQIELSFRDLKSHRYWQAFDDRIARKGPRIAVLLLLSALVVFAT